MSLKNIVKIKKKVDREREPLHIVRRTLKRPREIYWGFYGRKNRFYQIFEKSLKNNPILFLQERFANTKKNPQVMFLGPGKGEYILEFINALNYKSPKKIDPLIDVFALKKGLSEEVQRKIRNDFSSEIAFEKLNTKTSNEVVINFQKKLINSYDLIMAPLSVGFHTQYPANALFTSAMMLKKGGKAFVQVEDFKLYFEKKNNKSFYEQCTIKNAKKYSIEKKVKRVLYIQKQIDNMEKIFKRFVDSYNKTHETNFQFRLKRHEYFNKQHLDLSTVYFEIEKIR